MSRKKNVSYHNRVRLVRTARELSRKELAEAVDAHPQTIGYIERGEFNLSMDLALRICSALDVSLDALFSMTPFAPLTSEQLIGSAEG
ncbi:MAG: helix-turn-helix domain-containing protein [Pseudomonadota bacterium]